VVSFSSALSLELFSSLLSTEAQSSSAVAFDSAFTETKVNPQQSV
jgi:hypothetical protein